MGYEDIAKEAVRYLQVARGRTAFFLRQEHPRTAKQLGTRYSEAQNSCIFELNDYPTQFGRIASLILPVGNV